MVEGLISIVTPIYNSKKYLPQCIESVLKQTYGNFEHILIDDCSTDESAKIVKEYQSTDSRIKFLALEKNSGAGVARKDRKSTRLNSSHVKISYAVFCLKKKNQC